MPTPPSDVQRLTGAELDLAVEVLCAAFSDYPVMRFVLGDEGVRDAARLTAFVTYLTERRLLRGHPVLGVRREARLVAAANLDPPVPGPTPPALAERLARLRALVGGEAVERLERFGASSEPFEPALPHWHLGMIGVRPERQGEGLGRVVLDHVHALSAADPASSGVTLTTERPANVRLYEHFGYRVLGRTALPGFESVVMFRPDPT
jgi:GNAT superfamily N-acetyltransferase